MTITKYQKNRREMLKKWREEKGISKCVDCKGSLSDSPHHIRCKKCHYEKYGNWQNPTTNTMLRMISAKYFK